MRENGGAKLEMALITTDTDPAYTAEFRAYNDDAWYTVCVTMAGPETLRVQYQNFPEEHDNIFEPSFFESAEQLHGFEQRFRPLSKQVQDDECRQLVHGVRVCACHRFGRDDVRFYDAFVDGVIQKRHSWDGAEEVCRCKFVLYWIHGPNAENMTTTTVENICIVQPALEPDPVVDSFLKMTRERLRVMSSNGVCGLEMVPYCNEHSKENRRARKSSLELCSPEEVTCNDRRMEDNDLGDKKNVCMILIGNLERELCPSTVEQFLQRQTSESSRVFVFPSLSSEMNTRGAIMLYSERVFQKLCRFLTNPNHIITSSTGRPWVILEMVVGLKKIKASIGALVPISENAPHSGNKGTSNNLKILSSGTREFKIASDLRNLFVEFCGHQELLHKKLALEEKMVELA